MCRFLAVISTEQFDVEPYLRELENQAKNGKNSPHGDGWGLWMKSPAGYVHYRETRPIWERDVKFGKAQILLTHARKKGEKGARISLVNTHPFVKNNSAFMHNGIIHMEGERMEGVQGETDSEMLFHLLLEKGIRNAVRYVMSKYLFTSLNSVFFHDDRMYVIKYVRDNEDYHSIYLRREGNKLIISTESTGKPLPNGTVAEISEDLEIRYWDIFPDKSR